ncbi:IclR family transcriptional regulator [Luethyella okanaganae]|uniref:IclR family transcriptional regulator n=1 Tax=Luethyella okanaganae TaxID=69372 RepID=A0ABW1VEP1_9MICO
MSPVKPIRVLANTRDLVDLLSRVGPLTPAEIAEKIDVPRPSVYRLVDGLNAINLTETLSDSRVALSLRWLHIADETRAAMQEWSGAKAALTALVDATGQTAFLSVLRDDSAVCIDWVQGRGIGVLILKPGRALPLYAGAAGRLLLAYAADADAYLENAPFEQLTPSTLTSAEELRRDIAETLEQGFTVSDEDATVGIGALGMPILEPSGTARACVSIGGLAEDIRTRRAEFLSALGTAAAVLSASANAIDPE